MIVVLIGFFYIYHKVYFMIDNNFDGYGLIRIQ